MNGRRLSLALYSLLGAVVIGLFLTVHFLGISVYVITGGSMTGAVPKGAVAFDREVPVGELQVGDVITFRPPGVSGNVTHRIISVEKDNDGRPVFRTKGDANEAVDPWRFTLDRPLQAKYAFHIPGLGYVLAAFTFRVVRTAVLVVLGLAILLVTVSWFRKAPADEPCERDEEPFCGAGEVNS
jgi:signal peptidase I